MMFNTQLLDMSFPELQAVRDFTVIDNDNLTEAWFPSLWSVAGDVQVSYNAQLRSFRSATSAADSVSFLANFQLTEAAAGDRSLKTSLNHSQFTYQVYILIKIRYIYIQYTLYIQNKHGSYHMILIYSVYIEEKCFARRWRCRT